MKKMPVTIAFMMAIGLLTGCVIVPHPVTPNTERAEEIPLADDILVSVGPRRFLEKITDKVSKRRKDITVVDALTFRDAAFPDGGWQLTDLLESGNAARVASELDVQFLILIGAGNIEKLGEDKGLYVPGLIGLQYAEETSELSALVIDLPNAQPVAQYRIEASGKLGMANWVIFFAIKDPMTEAAVLRGLMDALDKSVAVQTGRDKTRIAILAAEADADSLEDPKADDEAEQEYKSKEYKSKEMPRKAQPWPQELEVEPPIIIYSGD